ncbi:MAG TPA: serine/threonine-protein kinase [Kofleriaceae bacterium]|nr:serine/threonine-protein kinase [Kofleriaceae bacterium]
MGEESATRRLGKLDLAETLPNTGGESEDLPFGGAIGRYLVLGVLGRGGMGVVYEAYDPVLDRRIAVKLLHELTADDASAGRARMQREAQALARLSHPNVITVHDVSEHGAATYIAMELVQGTTLHRWQARKGWREIIGAYIAAARGLGAAHAAGLVHRDFKPDNVLVGDDGRVRVTDFGLARLAGHAITAPLPQTSPLAGSLTEEGAVMGTPSYMAPEQIDGGTVDARSDQCGWCIALWEALYREQPFIGGTLELRSAAMKSDAPRPPASTQVPRAVARILLRGLQPDPEKRWPSMAALVGALERATSSRRVAIAVAGVAAAVLAVAVFVAGRSSAAPACGGAGAPVDALWAPAVERDIARVFAASGAPFAGDAVAALGRSVAGWRGRWQRIAVESCEATRVGTQSAVALDLRTACLMRARDQVRTALAAIAGAERPERKLVETAATRALPDLDACSDVAALAGAAAPPRDPVARLAIEAQLDALERVAKGSVSIEHARRLIPEAERQISAAVALAWAPLTARARRRLEELQFQLGDGKTARATLLAAAADASAAGDLDQLVEIYLELVEVEARLTSEFALGEGWSKLAGGTLARLGPRPQKQLAVTRSRGLIAQRAGRASEARDAYTAGLALAKAIGPVDELRLRIDLGLTESDLGELTSARDHLDRALELARRELGDKHPRVAQIQHNLGTVVYRQGRYAESERMFRTALEGRAAAYGTDSVDYALTLDAIGNAELMQDRVPEARCAPTIRPTRPTSPRAGSPWRARSPASTARGPSSSRPRRATPIEPPDRAMRSAWPPSRRGARTRASIPHGHVRSRRHVPVL